jgi:non-ribosomal peptide synthetase component F
MPRMAGDGADPTAYWHELTRNFGSIPRCLSKCAWFGRWRSDAPRASEWRQHVGEKVRLVNGYGPTETTVVATMANLSGSANCSVPSNDVVIGRPIANVQTYLLDRHLNPVPMGVPGEIHIGGAGVARGYLNCPELTAEKFIPHPFNTKPGAKLYKTGDLARGLPDGTVPRRIDDQENPRISHRAGRD